MSDEDKRKSAIDAIAGKAADDLAEFADTVIVIAQYDNPADEMDQRVTHTRGSQYTRYAILKEMVLSWEAYVKTFAAESQKRDMNNDEDNEP